MTTGRARLFHLVTAVVAIFALVFQLLLIIHGGRVLEEQQQEPMATRLGRFVSYFTIQSNLLVAIATVLLARDARRDGFAFRAVRLAGLLGIIVTGIVHWFFLRPLLHLHGSDYVADKLLHVVVPVLAVIGWALFGPRPRVDRRSLAWSLAWPIAYLVYVLVVGALTGWYPYPFLNVDDKGWGHVLVSAVGITVLFVLLFLVVDQVDRRARPVPADGVRASTVAP